MSLDYDLDAEELSMAISSMKGETLLDLIEFTLKYIKFLRINYYLLYMRCIMSP